MQALLEPLVVSWGYDAEVPGPSQFIDHHEYWGTCDIAAFLSVPEAIKFQQEHDWNMVRATCHELVREAQARIVALTGIPPLHPDDPTWYAQMATAPLPDNVDITQLKTCLYDEYHIEVPVMQWNGRKLVRVSIQGYNTRRDVDALLSALQNLLGK